MDFLLTRSAHSTKDSYFIVPYWTLRIFVYTVKFTLTLLPTGLSFPGCHGGGQNLPPQLKSHLGVLDSNSFIHALKAISN